MVYTYIPLNLSLSKLMPRSVKVSLLGYFEQESYKLLNQKTRTVFRLRDVIFEEDTTHLVK